MNFCLHFTSMTNIHILREGMYYLLKYEYTWETVSERKIRTNFPLMSGSRKDMAKKLEIFCSMENTRMSFFCFVLNRTETYILNNLWFGKIPSNNLKFETFIFYCLHVFTVYNNNSKFHYWLSLLAKYDIWNIVLLSYLGEMLKALTIATSFY